MLQCVGKSLVFVLALPCISTILHILHILYIPAYLSISLHVLQILYIFAYTTYPCIYSTYCISMHTLHISAYPCILHILHITLHILHIPLYNAYPTISCLSLHILHALHNCTSLQIHAYTAYPCGGGVHSNASRRRRIWGS